MCGWGSIHKPSLVGTENKKEKGGYEYEPTELENFYDKYSKRFFSITRLIFKVTLIPDRNLFIILAGSLAGLPINIITGKSTSDLVLFVAELVSSVLFYSSFLLFVLVVNRVREKGEKFDTAGCMTSFIPSARKNVEFAACYSEYKRIRRWFILSLFFFIITIIIVIAEPDFDVCVSGIRDFLLQLISCIHSRRLA